MCSAGSRCSLAHRHGRQEARPAPSGGQLFYRVALKTVTGRPRVKDPRVLLTLFDRSGVQRPFRHGLECKGDPLVWPNT
jgi:hypothetical protein